jgi:hypothetical protein
MGQTRRSRYWVLLATSLVLGAAVYLVVRNARDRADVAPPASNFHASSDAHSARVALGSALPARGPRLAPWLIGSTSSSDQESDDASSSPAALAEAARKERALMAKTWGMSEEQHRRFDAAVTAEPHVRRRAVHERFSRGELDQERFQKELEEADAQDSAELRAILGPHYTEYTLTYGHWAESGLDHRPFEPPIEMPAQR